MYLYNADPHTILASLVNTFIVFYFIFIIFAYILSLEDAHPFNFYYHTKILCLMLNGDSDNQP